MTNILIIAGLDLSLDVGIKSDIKTVSFLKKDISNIASCYTIQQNNAFIINYPDILFLKKQLDSFFSCKKAKFIKVGMIGNIDNIKLISSYLKDNKKEVQIIFDPIIKSSSDLNLMNDDVLNYIRNSDFLQNIDLITPNINEAEILSGVKINNISDVKLAANKIKQMGANNILVKGAHLNINDNKIKHYFLKDNGEAMILANDRVNLKKEARGTGCMLSTAIICFLSENLNFEESIKKANNFTENYLRNSHSDNMHKDL